jgi:MFS family permease
MATTVEVQQETEKRPSLGPVKLPSAFRSLAHRGFRFMWFGQVGSATAMHADMVARGVLVWELTGSSVAVGGVLGARALPMLTVGMFGGVAADRFDRKKLLMFIQTWSLLMHVIMATLILTGLVQLWHVYVIAVGLGASMALNQPVRTSIIPNLVPRGEMTNALTLNSIAINSTRLIGPAIIAAVIGVTNTGYAYVLSAVAFVVVVWMTMQIDMPQTEGRGSKGSPLAQLLEGFRFLGSNRLVLALVLLGMGPLAIGFAYQTLLPQLIDEMGYDTSMIGYIMSVGAIGGLTGGLTIASKRDISSKGKIMLLSAVAYGVALAGFAGAAEIGLLFLVFPLIIVIGVSQTTFRAMNTTILMETTPDHLRGRVVSVTLLDTGMMPAAALFAGYFADKWGVSSGFTTLAIGCFAVIGLVLLIYPKIRRQ